MVCSSSRGYGVPGEENPPPWRTTKCWALWGKAATGWLAKCRNKENGQIVAIKKFLESKDDGVVRKIAVREIKLLKVSRGPQSLAKMMALHSAGRCLCCSGVF